MLNHSRQRCCNNRRRDCEGSGGRWLGLGAQGGAKGVATGGSSDCEDLREKGHGLGAEVASKAALQGLRAMHVRKLEPSKALVAHEHVCLLRRQGP